MPIDEAELFARGPVAVFRWRNAEGWPVEWASANVAEMFGHTPWEFTSGGLAYASLVHGDDIARVGAEVAEALASDADSFEHEPYRVCHPDGSVRWLHDSTYLVRDGDEVTHFIGYVVDITARIEAEERRLQLERQLLHAQKLESLGLLAGGVAHDFNNLLTGVLGEVALARLELGATSDAVARGLDRIEILSLEAAELTRQLLAYSGRGRFLVLPVDLSEMVRDIATMLSVVTSKKAVLELDLHDALPAVQADRAQIRQVLMNLVTNASEALEDEVGVIAITTGVEELSAQALARDWLSEGLPEGVYVTVRVSDSGHGMSEEVMAQLFDPFFTTKATGRGLGMSAVQGIVRAHRGAIRVRSEEGRGSSFELLFPTTEEIAVSPRPVVAPDVWRGEGLALVVDDEPAVRQVAAAMLEALGFSVCSASDGAEALALYRQHRDEVAFVLLDMMMPVMGGAECLRQLRRANPALPVLMTSGFNEPEGLHPGEGARASGFIQKPYGMEALRAAVRAALDQ